MLGVSVGIVGCSSVNKGLNSLGVDTNEHPLYLERVSHLEPKEVGLLSPFDDGANILRHYIYQCPEAFTMVNAHEFARALKLTNGASYVPQSGELYDTSELWRHRNLLRSSEEYAKKLQTELDEFKNKYLTMEGTLGTISRYNTVKLHYDDLLDEYYFIIFSGMDETRNGLNPYVRAKPQTLRVHKLISSFGPLSTVGYRDSERSFEFEPVNKVRHLDSGEGDFKWLKSQPWIQSVEPNGYSDTEYIVTIADNDGLYDKIRNDRGKRYVRQHFTQKPVGCHQNAEGRFVLDTYTVAFQLTFQNVGGLESEIWFEKGYEQASEKGAE